ncbi:MAG: oxidoreductase [Streptosporangiaceae bacterium]|nr:oxidoreductase [Streptosporangiaceae bacterium]
MHQTLPGNPMRRAAVVPPKAAAWGRYAVVGVLLLGQAAVIWLWWHNTPSLTPSLADQFTAIGRLTGLSGAYLILVQLLLMSRLRWLDHTIGAQDLSSWHRDLGALTVLMLTAHTLFITLGYADRRGPIAETWALLREYPDVLMAYVGLILFLGIGVISIRAIRTRLAYETWYYLHLYVYLGLGLGFAHQFADGQEFAASLPARVFWSILHVAVIAALLHGRVWAPLRLNLTHRLRVTHVVREGPGVVSVYVSGRRLAELNARPGQFFRWRFLTRDGWWQAHPFSLSAAPDATTMRITVKALGDHTADLRRLRPGIGVLAEGPYGTFTADRRHHDDVLLIAGGIGIAPIRALLDDLPFGRAVVLYRARRPKDLVLKGELDAIAAQTGTRVVYLPGGANRQALSARGLASLVPDAGRRDVYVCGPPGMVESVLGSLRKLKVPKRQIHVDPFQI